MSKYQLAGDPSPAEIAQMCLVIQSKWTEQERRKRGAWAYEPAVTRVCEVEEVSCLGFSLADLLS